MIPLDSAHELIRLQASGELSAVQITQAALDSIRRTQPTINAYTHVADELAMKQAAAVDAKRMQGQPLGPLAGVPVAAKGRAVYTRYADHLFIQDVARGFMSPFDATVISKLRAADAVIVGKDEHDEFAMGASTENSYFGVTRNPWESGIHARRQQRWRCSDGRRG